jgi:hypothetical protein
VEIEELRMEEMAKVSAIPNSKSGVADSRYEN